MARILIIDDDQTIGNLFCGICDKQGYEAQHVLTLAEGVRLAAAGAFDIVVLDVWLPDGNGMEVLREIHGAPSSPEVLVVTGQGDPEGAEKAIMSGAWDYVEKPFALEEVSRKLRRAVQFREGRAAMRVQATRTPGARKLNRNHIVGNSPKLVGCLDLLSQAAEGDANVLLTGETGTGKEQFAWAIHENSARAGKPLVIVDCAALPETLVESILFGHERGVFTGADRAQVGMIKQADGGTLVLDEVGELSLCVQKAFLRVLQERRFRPLGGNQEISSDFRLIAVTNRNLDQMVREGKFRDDLLFRLRSFWIHLPPLRERKEDLEALAAYHMRRIGDRYGMEGKEISLEFLRGLTRYSWPGNIRELVHCMERALMAARHEPTLFADHLPTHIRAKVARASVTRGTLLNMPGGTADPAGHLPTLSQFRQTAMDEAEKEYLRNLLSLKGMTFQQACAVAGLSRPRLYALMRKHHLTRSDHVQPPSVTTLQE